MNDFVEEKKRKLLFVFLCVTMNKMNNRSSFMINNMDLSLVRQDQSSFEFFYKY